MGWDWTGRDEKGMGTERDGTRREWERNGTGREWNGNGTGRDGMGWDGMDGTGRDVTEWYNILAHVRQADREYSEEGKSGLGKSTTQGGRRGQ